MKPSSVVISSSVVVELLEVNNLLSNVWLGDFVRQHVRVSVSVSVASLEGPRSVGPSQRCSAGQRGLRQERSPCDRGERDRDPDFWIALKRRPCSVEVEARVIRRLSYAMNALRVVHTSTSLKISAHWSESQRRGSAHDRVCMELFDAFRDFSLCTVRKSCRFGLCGLVGRPQTCGSFATTSL